MPSRSAHRAALARSEEPAVIAPDGMTGLPALPRDFLWRNPIVGEHYDRACWELVGCTGVCSNTVARIRAHASAYRIELAPYRHPGRRGTVAGAERAFGIAAAWLLRHHDGIVYELLHGRPPPGLFPYRVSAHEAPLTISDTSSG